MNKCFGCGKFVKLGEGKVTRAISPDDFIQDFCEACVSERVEWKRQEAGIGASFNDYIGLNKRIEMV